MGAKPHIALACLTTARKNLSLVAHSLRKCSLCSLHTWCVHVFREHPSLILLWLKHLKRRHLRKEILELTTTKRDSLLSVRVRRVCDSCNSIWLPEFRQLTLVFFSSTSSSSASFQTRGECELQLLGGNLKLISPARTKIHNTLPLPNKETTVPCSSIRSNTNFFWG